MKRTRALAVAISALLAMLVAVPGAGVAQDTPADVSAGIVGPQWQLVTYRDEDGKPTPVPPGIGITMLLFADGVFGTAACSDYEQGEYRLAKDTLQLFPPSIRSRPCEPAAQRIDDAFYGAFGQVGSFSIDGAALRLRDLVGDPILTFTRAEVPADPTIAPWRLGRIADAAGTSGPVVEGSAPSFLFLPGGRVVGSTGCGSFLGSWQARDSLMTITDVDFRHHDCTLDLREQADVILTTLEEITDFTIRPAGLSLEDQGGVTRLALVPDIPLVGRNWTPTVALDENGEVRLAAEKLQTTSIRFAGNDVAGRTPCRDYSGITQRAGLAVTMFDLAAERESCTTRKAEKIFLATLGQVASHALRGTELEFLDVDGDPVMRLSAQPGLRDVPWVVSLMDRTPRNAKPTLRAPPAGMTLTADFGEDELLTGDTGRTTFTAFYSESGGASIDIEAAQASISGCGGRKKTRPECRPEVLYLRLLQDADGYEMRAAEGQMVLLSRNRESIVFVPATDDLPVN